MYIKSPGKNFDGVKKKKVSMSVSYSRKVKKICEKCKKEVPYFISVDNGKKFKCPLCKAFVDFLKCILIQEESQEQKTNMTVAQWQGINLQN